MPVLLRDAAWILLGVLLGTAAGFLVIDRLASLATPGAAPLASLALFVLLLGSLKDRTHASRIPI